MSRVDFLRNSRDLQSVKFLEFTRIASIAEKKHAIFFEGEDEKYYGIRISSITPELKWSAVKCGGKKIVLSLREKIRSHSDYKDAKCLFFVDADFDDNSLVESFGDVYVTPCYSIENLYFSEKVLQKVLSSEFGITEHCSDGNCFCSAMENFKNAQLQYLNYISHFNFWIKEYRKIEAQGFLNGKLNINNVNLDKLIKVRLDACDAVYDKSKIIDLFPDADAGVGANIDIKNAPHNFNINGHFWFRGKQHLEFMRLYIMKLKEDRCKNKDRLIFKYKGNVRICLTESNCISELSIYAETPKCLHDFLRRAC